MGKFMNRTEWLRASWPGLLLPGVLVGLLGLGGVLAFTAVPPVHRTFPLQSASPLLVSTVSAADLRDLAVAEQDLISGCMRARGFRYWPQVQGSSRYMQPLFAMPPSVAAARKHGFGPAAPADPNDAYVNALGRSRQSGYAVALSGSMDSGPQVTVAIPQGGVMGHSAEGCEAMAENRLYGSFHKWYAASTLVGEVHAILQSEVADSRLMTAAVNRWRSCVAARGYHWADLAQPEFAPDLGANPSQAAVADAICAAATHISSVAYSVAGPYAEKLDAEYRKELDAYQVMQQGAMPLAREVQREFHANAN
ncbi:MAG: hypothetical protein ACRDNF_14690 [Streptosporangiaceae bacterium]